MICDECETVAHCTKHGCIPKQPAPVQEPVAWMHTNAIGHVYFRKNPQDRTLNPVPLYTQPQPAPVQPVASVPIHPKTGPLWAMTTDKPDPERLPSYPLMALYTTPPAAQPAVPDAFGTREGEHPEYIQGWNDCRAEMLRGMKP